MLDFSGIHIVILLIVALLVVGPKELPKFLRMIGKTLGKLRRMADQFRTSFDEMARQSELDELRDEINKLRGERVPDVTHELPYQDEPVPAPILPAGATPAEPIASETKPHGQEP